ncbi:tetratricopeptide repeat protein [Sphaerisporangium aureirubrum]|uniref:Tetratricopeptide repeat protein n=1 Tax=Sphaerisporangium aureirubrum TaxID=1544736 RepID=A0ABW1NSP3_9ACTN
MTRDETMNVSGEPPEPDRMRIDAQVHDRARMYVANRDLTINTAPAAEDPFLQGVTYLQRKQYSLATTALELATRDPRNSARAHFLLAVALLDGRRPRLHQNGRRGIKRIERELEQALSRSPDHAGALLLWAIIKEDYYQGNHYDFSPPPPGELLSSALGALDAADEANDEDVAAILTHVEAGGSSVRRFLEEHFQRKKEQ